MKQVLATPRLIVYDDVLPEDQLAALWRHLQYEPYTTPSASSSGEWVKVWRLGDGEPWCTRPSYASKAPFRTPLDHLVEPARELALRHPEIVRPFEEIALRTYLYPRGTKLSWHDDRYAGALSFFAHPRWGSTWGGELMVADAPPPSEALQGKPWGPAHLGHEWEDAYFASFGTGHWITPRPNRLVLVAGDAYHCVNRVDPDAGDHVRCAIVGFYRGRVT